MRHQNNDSFRSGREVHRAPHPVDLFSWNHPVGKVPVLADLHSAKDSEVYVTTTDHSEACRAIEKAAAWHDRDRLFTRIDDLGVDLLIVGKGPHAQDSVFTV